jgi:hypothetical protein
MLQLPPELRQSRDVPHVLAMKQAYEGTVYLDSPTRFVTERQIEAGRLDGLKLLILPAVEYQNAATQKAVMEWVRAGGSLVLTPNSWLGDEYARPADYLSELGIEITGMELPEVRVGEAVPDIARGTGFIMGAISEVELGKVPKSRLTETEDWPFERHDLGLMGWGVQHTLSVTGPGATVPAAFEDGRPAIVSVPVGRGVVYYLATPLEAESCHRFFDALYDTLGVARPVRTVDGTGQNLFLVDARTLKTEEGYLCYVCNLAEDARTVTLQLPRGVIGVRSLSAEEELSLTPDGALTLPMDRFETVILRLRVGLAE